MKRIIQYHHLIYVKVGHSRRLPIRDGQQQIFTFRTNSGNPARLGYIMFQLTEVAIPRSLFANILRLIDGLRPIPLPP